MDHNFIYLAFACFFGLWMTWGVGANDLANVMSTTMGSKAVSTKQAMFIAVVFEIAGAYLGGDGVTETMRGGIINLQRLISHPEIIVWGMLAVLMAGTVWMTFASYKGFPVSITNAIVGSVVGFGAVVLGIHAVHWRQVGVIALSWIFSPSIAGVFAYILFTSIQTTILARSMPLEMAKARIPYYLFLVGLVISFITVFKALKHFHIMLTPVLQVGLLLTCAIAITIIGMLVINRIPEKDYMRRHDRFEHIEKMFGVLMALTACAMVFAHGSNDVAVAVGPINVIVAILNHRNNLNDLTQFPAWIILLGCSGVILGLFMYGRKVIETVGSGITALTPSRAFAATLAAASTVIVATSTGIPVSATQTLVGAVLGVGLARGIGALNLVVIRNIFMSWIITLPVASLLTIMFYHMLAWLLG